MTKKCKLHCDASVNRVGAVLLHAYPDGSDQLHLLPGLMARHNRTLSKLINKVDLILGGKNFHKYVYHKYFTLVISYLYCQF